MPRGRPRKSPKEPEVPQQVCVDPDFPLPSPAELERERLSAWMRDRMEQMERDHAARIELLRTAGEHPSPLFARQVRMFGALGLPKALVGKILCIGTHTMEAHYGEEYDLGAAEVIGQVAANMIRIGTSTTDPANAKVGMDILSRRGGQEWRPPAQKLEVDDTREKPKNVIDSSKLTAEQRTELRRMIEYAQGGGEGEPLQPGEEGAEGEPA